MNTPAAHNEHDTTPEASWLWYSQESTCIDRLRSMPCSWRPRPCEPCWRRTPQRSIREAIGDMEALREAVERLRDYHEFEPATIDRRRINAQLCAYAQLVGGGP